MILDILEVLKLIEEHIIRARYLLKDESGRFIVPSEYYDKQRAEKVLKGAKGVLEKSETLIDAILSKSRRLPV